MFYCCFLIFYWRKYKFSAINLLGSACFSVVHHRHCVEKPVNAGSLDGVTGVFIMFIYFLFCVALTINFFFRAFFFYTVRIIYDGMLTLSKYLFLIVCWVLPLDKNTSTCSLSGLCTHEDLRHQRIRTG